MAQLISEILQEVEAVKSKEEKQNVLRQYDTPLLRTIMRLNFDPMLVMDLPEGEPPYNKDKDKPMGYQETNLQVEFKRFYIWLTPQPNLPRMKKEALFIGLLESLHWTEAEVMVLAKDRQLQTKYKSLTEDLIRSVYDGCLTPKEQIPKELVAPLA
tara:strand:- start:2446 stop:2913 length:468 start_codon:yes stop_codon:yes gene_type:complete